VTTFTYQSAAPIEFEDSFDALADALIAIGAGCDRFEVAEEWAERAGAVHPAVDVDMGWLDRSFAGEIVHLPEIRGRRINPLVLALALTESLERHGLVREQRLN
jgi:hypothetical protein